MESKQCHAASHLPRWVIATLVLGGAGLPTAVTSDEGIPVGKWVFRPSVEALWQDESNLYLSSKDPIAATSYVIRPQLNWSLPFRESQFRASYSPQVRSFVDRGEDTQDLKDRYGSHFVELDLDLKFSNQLNVKVHDEYTIDTFETARFDAGQEVVFNSNRYHKNLGEIEILAPLGPRHAVGVRAVTDQLHFDETDEPIFLDHKHDRGSVFHEIGLTPLWRLRTSYLVGRGAQERQPNQIFEKEEVFSSADARVLLRGLVGPHGSLEARLGYLRWDFDNAALADYSGLTGEVRYRLNLAERANLLFTAVQMALPSFFNVNSHYLTRVFEARWNREGEARFFYALSMGYRTNEYPVAYTEFSGTPPVAIVTGPRREDKLWRGEGSMGYKFNNLLKVEGRFRHEERSSNLEVYDLSSNRLIKYDFNSNRFIVSFTWGWI